MGVDRKAAKTVVDAIIKDLQQHKPAPGEVEVGGGMARRLGWLGSVWESMEADERETMRQRWIALVIKHYPEYGEVPVPPQVEPYIVTARRLNEEQAVKSEGHKRVEEPQ